MRTLYTHHTCVTVLLRRKPRTHTYDGCTRSTGVAFTITTDRVIRARTRSAARNAPYCGIYRRNWLHRRYGLLRVYGLVWALTIGVCEKGKGNRCVGACVLVYTLRNPRPSRPFGAQILSRVFARNRVAVRDGFNEKRRPVVRIGFDEHDNTSNVDPEVNII